MDDLLLPAKGPERTKALSNGLQTLFMKWSFNLTKWVSNHSDVIKDRKSSEKNPTVIGMEWLLEGHELKVCRGVFFESQPQGTQKELLSKVSSLFDPLVFMVPLSIREKLITKQIWRTQGQQWDKPIEERSKKVFNSWILDLSQNNLIAVQRYFKMTNNDKREIYVFGDASEDAFRDVPYVLSASADYTHVSFAIGKTDSCTNEASYHTKA